MGHFLFFFGCFLFYSTLIIFFIRTIIFTTVLWSICFFWTAVSRTYTRTIILFITWRLIGKLTGKIRGRHVRDCCAMKFGAVLNESQKMKLGIYEQEVTSSLACRETKRRRLRTKHVFIFYILTSTGVCIFVTLFVWEDLIDEFVIVFFRPHLLFHALVELIEHSDKITGNF